MSTEEPELPGNPIFFRAGPTIVCGEEPVDVLGEIAAEHGRGGSGVRFTPSLELTSSTSPFLGSP